jgi:uncharacterized membrane protein
MTERPNTTPTSEKQAVPRQPGLAADHQTLVAPCNDLNPADTLRWLRLGWHDYWRVPGISLSWGLFVFAISLALSWLGWKVGGWILLLAMLTGFVFVAPLLAFALYSVSRQLCLGKRPSLRRTLLAMRRPFQNSLVFSLLLLVIFLVWARAGSMVHVFFPVDRNPELLDVLRFLAIGSAIGSVFAGFTFSATAFSLPMLANRDVDVVTAVVSSVNAVLRNKFTCATWAVMIAILTTLGLVTGLLGLILVIPWLGYASWHAYREALDVSAWPTLPVKGRGE